MCCSFEFCFFIYLFIFLISFIAEYLFFVFVLEVRHGLGVIDLLDGPLGVDYKVNIYLSRGVITVCEVFNILCFCIALSVHLCTSSLAHSEIGNL